MQQAKKFGIATCPAGLAGQDPAEELARVSELEAANRLLMAELAARMQVIEASEARLAAATDAGDFGIWELDLRSGELYVSDHCKRNFGRPVGAPFSYQSLQHAVHPDDQQRMQATVANTVATGEDYRIDYRIVRPDGGLAWIRVRGRVHRDGNGQPARLVGTSQDITDAMLARRRADLLLMLDSEVFNVEDEPTVINLKALQALGQTLEATRAGYGEVDVAGECVTIECEWTDPSTERLAGTLPLRDFGHYANDLQRGDVVTIADALLDARTSHAAQSLIDIGARALLNVPIMDGGRLIGVLYLTQAGVRAWRDDERELTREVALRTRHAVQRRRMERRLRQSEAHLRQLSASLDQQVQERTAQLVESQTALHQAQKMEAVGQLTAGLAHDFNNLLGAISGSLELLKRRMGEGDPAQRHVEISRTAVRRAAMLTHRLLAFSRQQTLETRIVDVNMLVEGFAELVRRTLGPHIALEIRPAPGLWHVRADAGQLENALLNLCINARDAMPAGGQLVISTANCQLATQNIEPRDLPAGDFVVICVQDSGSGMSPEVMAKAFDPFFTTKSIGAGSGLGLSMVYGFARQSGGQVRISSEPGVGTTVSVFLPRCDGAATLDPTPGPSARAASVSGLGKTVMVVDDEPGLRAVMVDVLRANGCQALEAAEGKGALQLLQAHKTVGLLVTDLGLSGSMNGWQLAQAARRQWPALPVLFVTGYAPDSIFGGETLPSDMTLLSKPFAIDVFSSRVATLLGLPPAGE